MRIKASCISLSLSISLFDVNNEIIASKIKHSQTGRLVKHSSKNQAALWLSSLSQSSGEEDTNCKNGEKNVEQCEK
jgi:hypothetical protein